jgi:hypothetical protein
MQLINHNHHILRAPNTGASAASMHVQATGSRSITSSTTRAPPAAAAAAATPQPPAEHPQEHQQQSTNNNNTSSTMGHNGNGQILDGGTAGQNAL